MCNLKKKKLQEGEIASSPWFDRECEDEKIGLRNLGSQLKQNPCDQNIRTELNKQKRNFKKLVKSKKRQYKHNTLKQMTNKKNKDQKYFWNMLKRISPSRNIATGGIPPETFADYFKTILTSKNPLDIPEDSKDIGPLDYNISLEELKKASTILKPGKALGIDNISNEMIQSLLDCYPEIILLLFNSILELNEIIPEWVIGAIVPIHKKGPKSEPNNYRGITLMSCLGKLFISVLNNRLLLFTIHNKILSDSQLGFLAGNRTSDAHIILNNIVRKHCHKNNTKIFSCFIDFSKAFDTVPRDILFKKLLRQGINGRFFNIIKNIYNNDEACVKMHNQCTETFKINQGVRQGCVLSPLLFNIFLSDLAKKLNSIEGKVQVHDREVNTLFWADDIIMFTKEENTLREMLETLEEYTKENKLEINTDKTKIMIFNKTGRLMRRAFHINGIQLENVRTYKYLGFLLTPSGEINSGLHDLRDRALKAFMKLRNNLGTSFNQDIMTTLTLVDAMIKPILLYNSDFWGCMKLPKNNPIENLHMLICKQLLGVHRSTTNIGVLLELGRIPLKIYAVKLAVKNWERIKKNKANCLVLASYSDAVGENLLWLENIRNTLEKHGMLSFFINSYDDKPLFINKRIFQTLSDEFHQNAFETIKEGNSKLRTYALFKKKIGPETYLSQIKKPTIRTQLSKFRLSNHALMIETGRHNKIPKEKRFCPFCPTLVETEIHFLFQCSTYSIMRDIFHKTITENKPEFPRYTFDEKLEYIMTNIDENVAKYINDSLEVRTFLLIHPKRYT